MKIHVEVFIAGKILEQRQSTFSPNEIIDFLRTEFCDERHGIPTHVSAACIYHHNKPKTPGISATDTAQMLIKPARKGKLQCRILKSRGSKAVGHASSVTNL